MVEKKVYVCVCVWGAVIVPHTSTFRFVIHVIILKSAPGFSHRLKSTCHRNKRDTRWCLDCFFFLFAIMLAADLGMSITCKMASMKEEEKILPRCQGCLSTFLKREEKAGAEMSYNLIFQCNKKKTVLGLLNSV